MYNNDKSHYLSSNNIFTEITVICEENIFQLTFARRFKNRSDLSLYGHKFDLIYYQWNTTEHDAVPNVSFLIFLYNNSISHYF